MTSDLIFKRLKQRFNYLQDNGYEVVYIALQGSQNYKLDLYTDTYKSDIDCMAVVLPSVDDFVQDVKPISTTLVLDNNEHINIKDVREMFNLYKKQNIQFLETLFTDYKIINKKYKDLGNYLYSLADEISNICRKDLYMSIIGMSMQKHQALTHPYPSIKDKIDKYGYDGKQLSHQIRLNAFINNLHNGLSFKDGLTHFDIETLELIMDAKLNKIDLEKAKQLDEYYLEQTYKFKAVYEGDNTVNEETVSKLNRIKTDLIKQYLAEQLAPDPKPVDFDINKYKNVYVTSDCHFGHTNIIKYEHRDEKLNISGTMEHDEALIAKWNNIVKKNDLVIITGDFSFHKPDKTMEILDRLNGDKVLIEGNHDCIYLKNKKFDKSKFKLIKDYWEVNYRGTNFCFMHYPISHFKHSDKDINGYIHIFGHIHSIPFAIPRHSFNAGVDVNNYTPVHILSAVDKALRNGGGNING